MNSTIVNICIPKANCESLSKKLVFTVFKSLKIGFIKNVVIHTNGCIFIYFAKWFDNEHAISVKNKLLDGESIYVTYDYNYGWFWKCTLMRNSY